MTKELNKLRDELAFAEQPNKDGSIGNCPECFKRGFDAAIQALSEAAGEFDEQAFTNVYQPVNKNDEIHAAIEEGARWQFERGRARIGLAEVKAFAAFNNDIVNGHRHMIKQLEARLAELEEELKMERDK